MKTYIQISSIIVVYISVILFYKWIGKKFDDKIRLIDIIAIIQEISFKKDEE